MTNRLITLGLASVLSLLPAGQAMAADNNHTKASTKQSRDSSSTQADKGPEPTENSLIATGASSGLSLQTSPTEPITNSIDTETLDYKVTHEVQTPSQNYKAWMNLTLTQTNMARNAGIDLGLQNIYDIDDKQAERLLKFVSKALKDIEIIGYRHDLRKCKDFFINDKKLGADEAVAIYREDLFQPSVKETEYLRNHLYELSLKFPAVYNKIADKISEATISRGENFTPDDFDWHAELIDHCNLKQQQLSKFADK